MDQLARDLKSLLTETQIKDLVARKTKPLVALGHKVDIGTVLETLSQHGLLSAPIFISDNEGAIHPSLATLIGFVDTWTVLAAFIQALGNNAEISAEQLEQQGVALCSRPVLDLFEGGSAFRAAIESGDVEPTCADWDTHDNPNSSLLEVIRSCFLPRSPGTNTLTSWQSGAGFSLSATAPSPRAPAAGTANGPAGHAAGNPAGTGGSENLGRGSSPHAVGHSRHPAASHRIVVVNPEDAGQHLVVLSQSDILRFLAAHHESLRPLGKASLAELGLATGSLHLAAGPQTATGTSARPPTLHTPTGSGGANHSSGFAHLPPSSPKPPLASSAGQGGGGLLGSLGGVPASPGQESHMFNLLQRANSSGSGGGPTAMQMSPPASPRVSLDRLSGGMYGNHGLGHHHSGSSGGHRLAARRQLVAVHESVTALEAFRVLLQQRVSAVAVLSGVGSSVNMRLVGNLSASDLRYLKPGGFGRLAMTVKQFLASKPLAPDQAIPLKTPNMSPPPTDTNNNSSTTPPPSKPPTVVMAHAPGVYTCQATASLEELVKMLGAPQHGIHRVYVVDPDQRPAGVVTGTDVLSLLSAACSRD